MSIGQKFIKSVRSEGKSSSKALFPERGHWKVNARTVGEGPCFIRFWSALPLPSSSFSGPTLIGWTALGAGLSIPDWLVSVVRGVIYGHS